MIYNLVWTVPDEEYEYMIGIPRPAMDRVMVSFDYLRAQLSAIRKLGAINRFIRAEAYGEYFDHTQIMLRYETAWSQDAWPQPGRSHPDWDGDNRKALYIMSSSYLLQTQARHVYLYWPARFRHDELSPHSRYILGPLGPLKGWRHEEELLNEQWAVECVSRFKNLKTLEIHLNATNGWADLVWDVSEHVKTHSYSHNLYRFFVESQEERNRDPRYSSPAEHLRRMFWDNKRRARFFEGLKGRHRGKLEKAVIVTGVWPDQMKLFKILEKHHPMFGWWREFKEDVATLEAPKSSSDEVCVHFILYFLPSCFTLTNQIASLNTLLAALYPMLKEQSANHLVVQPILGREGREGIRVQQLDWLHRSLLGGRDTASCPEALAMAVS